MSIEIKDPIHGMIELEDVERRVVDTEEFQRLRNIKQLALTYLVYPGATHTRFEHSLGTLYLSSEIAKKLHLDKEETSTLRLYSLLHDIGHCAFSHEAERVTNRYIGTHEEIGKRKISSGEIGDLLRENYTPNEIISVGEKAVGNIVNSMLGADRMDYLLRDSYHTGVAYGIVDAQRIIRMMEKDGQGVYIKEGGLEAAESLLIARFMMFSTVYFHHTVRIASAMLSKAIEVAISDEEIKPEDFLKAEDSDVIRTLERSNRAREYVTRIKTRNLYKRVCTFHISEKDVLEKVKSMEDVLIDIPEPIWKDESFRVEIDGTLKSLSNVSPIIRSLQQAEKERMTVLVLCKKESKEKIKRTIEQLLG